MRSTCLQPWTPAASFVCAEPECPTCLRCACRQLAFLLIAAESCTQHEALKEHAGKSEPLFLVYRVRNKQIHVLSALNQLYTGGQCDVVWLDDLAEWHPQDKGSWSQHSAVVGRP